jgi:hypothetical protein
LWLAVYFVGSTLVKKPANHCEFRIIQLGLIQFNLVTCKLNSKIAYYEACTKTQIQYKLLLLLSSSLLLPLYRVFTFTYLKQTVFSRAYSVVAVLCLQFVLHVMLFCPSKYIIIVTLVRGTCYLCRPTDFLGIRS